MKKSEGISLISLIVTIVVIIILSGMVIYNGIRKNIDETINTLDYNEIFEVSEAVAQRGLLNKLNPNMYKLIGESGEFTVTMEVLSGDEKAYVDNKFKSSDGWYLIDKRNYKNLNLEKIRGEYIVNYKTNEVITREPIYYEGEKYYVASVLKDALTGNSAIVSYGKYNEEKGVNKPFIVSGMVPVKRVKDKWVVTNADDNEWYDYAANYYESEESLYGNLWANVMLMDEITVEGMTNSEVRSATLSSLEGKAVTKEGSMYVWIPRYSRGIIDGETKIVFSRLTEDYFKEPTSENVLDIFENDGVELTGIWVSKYDVGYIEE